MPVVPFGVLAARNLLEGGADLHLLGPTLAYSAVMLGLFLGSDHFIESPPTGDRGADPVEAT